SLGPGLAYDYPLPTGFNDPYHYGHIKSPFAATDSAFSFGPELMQADAQAPGSYDADSLYSASGPASGPTGAPPAAASVDGWSRRSNKHYLDRLPPGYYDNY